MQLGGAPLAMNLGDGRERASTARLGARHLSSDSRGNAVSFATVFAVSLLAAASSSASVDANSVQPVALTSSPTVAATASGARDRDPDKPSLNAGSRAPDFQYQSYDALWQHLHNVLEHGDVLLVFGASDVDLRTLERERETLVKSGVMPLAVVEHNDRDVWASVRRLGLTYSLLADPKGAIGQQYGVFDASLGRSRSAWFVIDVKGRVRQSGGDRPALGWPAVAATALGRPLAGSTQGASKH
jgi:peroxiredoxin